MTDVRFSTINFSGRVTELLASADPTLTAPVALFFKNELVRTGRQRFTEIELGVMLQGSVSEYAMGLEKRMQSPNAGTDIFQRKTGTLTASALRQLFGKSPELFAGLRWEGKDAFFEHLRDGYGSGGWTGDPMPAASGDTQLATWMSQAEDLWPSHEAELQTMWNEGLTSESVAYFGKLVAEQVRGMPFEADVTLPGFTQPGAESSGTSAEWLAAIIPDIEGWLETSFGELEIAFPGLRDKIIALKDSGDEDAVKSALREMIIKHPGQHDAIGPLQMIYLGWSDEEIEALKDSTSRSAQMDQGVDVLREPIKAEDIKSITVVDRKAASEPWNKATRLHGLEESYGSEEEGKAVFEEVFGPVSDELWNKAMPIIRDFNDSDGFWTGVMVAGYELQEPTLQQVGGLRVYTGPGREQDIIDAVKMLTADPSLNLELAQRMGTGEERGWDDSGEAELAEEKYADEISRLAALWREQSNTP